MSVNGSDTNDCHSVSTSCETLGGIFRKMKNKSVIYVSPNQKHIICWTNITFSYSIKLMARFDEKFLCSMFCPKTIKPDVIGFCCAKLWFLRKSLCPVFWNNYALFWRLSVWTVLPTHGRSNWGRWCFFCLSKNRRESGQYSQWMGKQDAFFNVRTGPMNVIICQKKNCILLCFCWAEISSVWQHFFPVVGCTAQNTTSIWSFFSAFQTSAKGGLDWMMLQHQESMNGLTTLQVSVVLFI